MPKVVTKLFRELDRAEKALSELKAKGYQAKDIGVVAGQDKAVASGVSPVAKASLADAGAVILAGAVAGVAKEKDPGAALAALWGVSEDALSYYKFGVFLGGVVISVHAEEKKVEKAREILRAVETEGEHCLVWTPSPGFLQAGRMSATDPVDAKMTGDFRKY